MSSDVLVKIKIRLLKTRWFWIPALVIIISHIFAPQGDLTWDQFQMLISKSTTADLLKILNKLEEFFSQQFKSSKKLFSSLEPGPVRKLGAVSTGKFSTTKEPGLKFIYLDGKGAIYK